MARILPVLGLLMLLVLPRSTPAGDWLLGVDQNVGLAHQPCESDILVDSGDPGLLLGRRWDSGWILAASVSVVRKDEHGGSRVHENRWSRGRLGRALVRDGRWSLWGAIEGTYAWSDRVTRNDVAGNGSREWAESWSLGLVLRPEVRIWRRLRVGTACGVQLLRTERETTSLRSDGRRFVTRLVSEGWNEFRGLDEHDLTFTWSF